MLVQGSGFKPYLSTTHLSLVFGSQSLSLVDVGGCLYGLIHPVLSLGFALWSQSWNFLLCIFYLTN